ncbi:phage tail tube protein [Archangium lansingense]|uniref:phage tail tube protein n=1 Tax=Archangium lansingense TaxID=2995310 RepID=UPI003B76E92F
MSDPLISHKVPIHVTAAPDTVLSDTNKVEAATTFTVTEEEEFEEEKFLNSDGYTERTIVWSTLTGGNLSGTRRPGSASQEVIETARKNKEAFFIHVVLDPAATAGSKGWRYKAFVKSDPKNFEAATLLKFDWALEFSGAPVAI